MSQTHERERHAAQAWLGCRDFTASQEGQSGCQILTEEACFASELKWMLKVHLHARVKVYRRAKNTFVSEFPTVKL